MRENRPYGSEGGEVQKPSLPLSRFRRRPPADWANLVRPPPRVLKALATRPVLGTRRRTISCRDGLLTAESAKFPVVVWSRRRSRPCSNQQSRRFTDT